MTGRAAPEPFEGKIAEIIVFGGAHSREEIDRIFRYMAEKYPCPWYQRLWWALRGAWKRLAWRLKGETS